MHNYYALAWLTFALLCPYSYSQVKAVNDAPDGSVRIENITEPESSATTQTPNLAPIILPLKPMLDAPDMKRVLTAQREQQFYRAEMESFRAKMIQAEGQKALWDKELINIADELRKRYNCPGCGISPGMMWIVPAPNMEGVEGVKSMEGGEGIEN